MPNYKSMYFQLAGQIADIIELMLEVQLLNSRLCDACGLLVKAQQQAEEACISGEDQPLIQLLGKE